MILNIFYQIPFKSDKEFCCHTSDLSFHKEEHTCMHTQKDM